jgi:hypothetical protein
VYYNGLAFNTAITARVDSEVNFVWSTGSAGIYALPATQWSAKWTGTLRAKFSGKKEKTRKKKEEKNKAKKRKSQKA